MWTSTACCPCVRILFFRRLCNNWHTSILTFYRISWLEMKQVNYVQCWKLIIQWRMASFGTGMIWSTSGITHLDQRNLILTQKIVKYCLQSLPWTQLKTERRSWRYVSLVGAKMCCCWSVDKNLSFLGMPRSCLRQGSSPVFWAKCVISHACKGCCGQIQTVPLIQTL